MIKQESTEDLLTRLSVEISVAHELKTMHYYRTTDGEVEIKLTVNEKFRAMPSYTETIIQEVK